MAIVKKSANIEVTAKTEGAVKGLDRVAKSTDRARTAAEAAGKSQARLGQSVERMAKGFSAARAAVNAFIGLQLASKMDELADRSFRVDSVMRNLPIGIGEARKATAGLATDFELGQAAANAFRLGVVKNEDEFAKLAEAATKLGLSVGQDAAKSVSDLTTALGRQSPMILDNLGITLKVSEAHAIYASSIGKTAEELTDAEKKQAFMTVAMDRALEASEKVNISTESGAASWKRLTVEVTNFIDTNLPKVLDATADGVFKIQEGITLLIGDITGLNGELARLDAEAGGRTTQRGLGRLGGVHAETIAAQNELQSLFESNQKFLDDLDRKRAEAAANLKKKRGGGSGGKSLIDRALSAADQGQDESLREAQKKIAESERVVSEAQAEFERGAEEARQRELDALTQHSENVLNIRLRSIEERAAAGADPMQLIADEEGAQLRHLEFLRSHAEEKAELMSIEDQRRQVLHESNMRRMAEEKAAEARRLKEFETTMNTTVSTTRFATNVAILAAEAAGKSEDDKARAANAAAAVMSGVQAAVEAARSIAAFARYDFGAGAAHAAAAVAFTSAAIQAGRAAGTSTGAGLGPQPQFGGGGGFGGAANGHPAPSRPGVTQIPRSLPSRQEQQQAAGLGSGPRSAASGGGRVVVIEQFNQIGEISEDTATTIGRGIRRAEGSVGSP